MFHQKIGIKNGICRNNAVFNGVLLLLLLVLMVKQYSALESDGYVRNLNNYIMFNLISSYFGIQKNQYN